MYVRFQSRSEEATARMNTALVGADLDLEGRSLALTFDTTDYDAEEVKANIDEHVGKGAQNLVLEGEEERLAMVVDPIGKPAQGPFNLILRYRVLAHTKD